MLPRFAPNRNQGRLALQDMEFISEIRRLSLPELEQKLVNYSHKRSPRWKRVAIRSRIARLSPRSIEWVMGIEEALPKIQDESVSFDGSGARLSSRDIALDTLARLRVESSHGPTNSD